MKEQTPTSSESSAKVFSRRDVLKTLATTGMLAALAKLAPSGRDVSEVVAQTVPLPPEIPPEHERIIRFRSDVTTTDSEGNPVPGVRIVFVEYDGDELIPYIEGGWRGAPSYVVATREDGRFVEDYEFAYWTERGIVLGAEALEIAEIVPGGDLPDYPPHQFLQEATVVISDLRSGQGEGPMEVTARLRVPINPEEEYSALIVVKNPEYRRGYHPILVEGTETTPPVLGPPVEIGEYYGFLPPLPEDRGMESHSVLTAHISTQDTPTITFETTEGTIVVSNEPDPGVAMTALVAPVGDESDLLLTVADSTISDREREFQEMMEQQQVSPASTSIVATESTVSNLKMVAVRSSRPGLAHRVLFNAADGTTLEAVVSDVVKGDQILLNKVDGSLVYEVSGEDGHTPTVQIIGSEPENPEEPEVPENPEEPEVPENPEEPEVPENPEEPEVPENPEEPEVPENPEVPKAPENPEVPKSPNFDTNVFIPGVRK